MSVRDTSIQAEEMKRSRGEAKGSENEVGRIRKGEAQGSTESPAQGPLGSRDTPPPKSVHCLLQSLTFALSESLLLLFWSGQLSVCLLEKA